MQGTVTSEWLAWCCSVPQSSPTLCEPTGCSSQGLPVHHCLPELAQTHVHRVDVWPVSFPVFPGIGASWPLLPALSCALICLSSSVRVQGPGFGRGPLPGDLSQTRGLEGPSAPRVCVPVGILASLSALPTLPSAHGHSTRRPPPRLRFHAEARPVCHARLPMSHL